VSAKILLTGVPGVGKTTLIREIARLLGGKAGGFYTEETREGRTRTGFDIVTLDGRRAALSRVNMASRFRVGKYGVDLDGLDSVAVRAVEDSIDRNQTIVIDEIGKMELFSEAFRHSVARAFDSPNLVVAVVMLKSHPFADQLKQRPGVETIEVTMSNRDRLAPDIVRKLTETREPGLL
jgi:nucleoside-triphosphatase